MPEYKNAAHLAKFRSHNSELSKKLTQLARLQAMRSAEVATAKKRVYAKYAERITTLQGEIKDLYRPLSKT